MKKLISKKEQIKKQSQEINSLKTKINLVLSLTLTEPVNNGELVLLNIIKEILK